MILAKIPRDLWLRDYAKDAHLSVFGHEFPDYETTLFDFVLMVIDKEMNTPIIYNMIRLFKTNTAYIEYGGSFPAFRGSSKVRKAFTFLLDELQKIDFQVVTLMTTAENVPMQKLALAVGFKVFGVTMGRSGLCLEYRLVFNQKENTDESMGINGNRNGVEPIIRGSTGSAEEAPDALCG